MTPGRMEVPHFHPLYLLPMKRSHFLRSMAALAVAPILPSCYLTPVGVRRQRATINRIGAATMVDGRVVIGGVMITTAGSPTSAHICNISTNDKRMWWFEFPEGTEGPMVVGDGTGRWTLIGGYTPEELYFIANPYLITV